MNTKANSLMSFYETNELDRFTELLNSEENINKKQKNNLLSYIISSKPAHQNVLSFLKVIQVNGNFNLGDPALFLLALCSGSVPEIARFIFENNKEKLVHKIQEIKDNTFFPVDFNQETRQISYLKYQSSEINSDRHSFSFSNIFNIPHSKITSYLHPNLIQNLEILMFIKNLKTEQTPFLYFFKKSSIQEEEQALLILKSFVDKKEINIQQLFNMEFFDTNSFLEYVPEIYKEEESSLFAKSVLGLHIKENNISEIIEYRPLIESFIKNHDIKNFKAFIEQEYPLSTFTDKNNPAGLSFFKMLKNETFFYLKNYHESSDPLKKLPNYNRDKFFNFSKEAFLLILNKYDTPRQDIIFNDNTFFNNYTSWIKTYKMDETYVLLEKYMLLNSPDNNDLTIKNNNHLKRL